MPNVYESGYTQLLNYGRDATSELGALDDTGGSIGTLTDTIGSDSSDMLTNLTTDEVSSGSITGGKLLDGITMQQDTFIKSEGVTAYNDGTGYYLGWDETLAEYVFFIGNSAGNKMTWDGSTLSITGTITADSGTIGGWEITTGAIYSLQSGTPTSSPNDGVVLVSGNEALIIYEDTAKRIEVGYLSAGIYGIKGYATDGTTTLFELSDTQQIIAGWTISDTTLANGTSIILDANTSAISVQSSTFGDPGIQLQFNGGTTRFYAGDGANRFINYDPFFYYTKYR